MERDANTATKTGAAALGGASMVAAAAVAVALVAHGAVRRGALSPDDIGIAMLAFYAAWPVVLLVGWPLFLGLHRLGWLRWWSCALAGAAGGAGFVAILGQVRAWQMGDLAVWAMAGAVGALAFWAAMRGRGRVRAGSDDGMGDRFDHAALRQPLDGSPRNRDAAGDEFRALLLASIARPGRTAPTPRAIAQACGRSGLGQEAFCDAYARFLVREFARGELSHADAALAIGDLLAALNGDVPGFALRIYHAFDAGEYARPGDEPGTVAWQVHALPQVMQALAEHEHGDER